MIRIIKENISPEYDWINKFKNAINDELYIITDCECKINDENESITFNFEVDIKSPSGARTNLRSSINQLKKNIETFFADTEYDNVNINYDYLGDDYKRHKPNSKDFLTPYMCKVVANVVDVPFMEE